MREVLVNKKTISFDSFYQRTFQWHMEKKSNKGAMAYEFRKNTKIDGMFGHNHIYFFPGLWIVKCAYCQTKASDIHCSRHKKHSIHIDLIICSPTFSSSFEWPVCKLYTIFNDKSTEWSVALICFFSLFLSFILLLMYFLCRTISECCYRHTVPFSFVVHPFLTFVCCFNGFRLNQIRFNLFNVACAHRHSKM